MEFLRRTWAEIDLYALERNYNYIRSLMSPETKLMAVVKADAYGHGDATIANELSALGADWFGVSNIEEALSLRRHGIDKPILIFGFTPPFYSTKLAENRITQAVFSKEYANYLSRACVRNNITVDVHIKIDSGMGRIGFGCCSDSDIADCAEQILEISHLNGLNITGAFTHFASADDPLGAADYTKNQYQRFCAVTDLVRQRGMYFELLHCCNSAGTINYPEFHLDMVRPGNILYGLSPDITTMPSLPLSPVMQLKSVVSMVKQIKAGTFISYGRTFAAAEDMTVATVSIGYADGYPRLLSSKARMLINGHYAPVVGRVCMDQVVVDVTGIPDVKQGTIVTVFGQDGGNRIAVEEISSLAGTVNYETVCLIGRRVPRIYRRGDEVVGVVDYIATDAD